MLIEQFRETNCITQALSISFTMSPAVISKWSLKTKGS